MKLAFHFVHTDLFLDLGNPDDVYQTTQAYDALDRLGEKTDDPLAMYMNDILTVAANLAGNPAISLPCGHSADGLPIGLQLMAPRFGEAKLMRVAHAYEKAAAPPFPWPAEPDAGAKGTGAARS